MLKQPDYCQAHYNAADCLRVLGRKAESERYYRQSLKLNPNYFEAQCWLARVLFDLGRGEEARKSFEIARTLRPEQDLRLPAVREATAVFLPSAEQVAPQDQILLDAHKALSDRDYTRALGLYSRLRDSGTLSAEILVGLAGALEGLNKIEEALSTYSEACASYRETLQPYLGLGGLYFRLNRCQEAQQTFKEAQARFPSNLELVVWLARCQRVLQNTKGAAQLLERVLTEQPGNCQAINELAELALENHDPAKAQEYFQQVVNLQPDSPAAYFNLARVQSISEDFRQSEINFKKVLVLDPKHIAAITELGTLYSHTDRLEQARECYERALVLQPGYHVALNNLANLTFHQRRPDDGVEICNQILETEFTNEGTRWNRGLMNLLRGDYEQGWRDFESRRKALKLERHYRQPYWDGSPLQDKTIFIYQEQGQGDCIHCARYLPLLVAQGARVVVECRKALFRLFESIPGIELILPDQKPPEFDFHAGIMSLPMLFGTTLRNVPNIVPYLQAPPDLKERWQKLGLHTWPKPRIGFVFRGARFQDNNRHRSCTLKDLQPVLDIPGLTFTCLQKELTAQDRESLRSMAHIHVLEEQLHDFANTAAVIEDLDLVITVDTSVAHLAGALGKPVWIMLCRNSSWQWLLEREDSPWYPTARLFRQESLDDWGPVVAALRVALLEFFELAELPEDVPLDRRPALAQAYLQSGNHAAALKIAAEFAQLDSRDPRALFIEAECCRAQGRYAEALQLLQRCLTITPSDLAFQHALALTYRAREELDLAETSARRVCESAPEVSSYQLNLMEILIGAGRFEAAVAAGQAAVQVLPKCVPVLLCLARAALELNRLQEAEKALEQVHSADSGNAEADAIRARLLMLKGDRAQALLSAQRAAANAPHRLDLVLDCARICAGIQEPDTALALFNAVLEQEPQNFQALAESGDVLAAQHRAREALERYFGALQQVPGTAALYEKMADVWLALGDNREACASLFQALYLEPGNTSTRLKLEHASGGRAHV